MKRALESARLRLRPAGVDDLKPLQQLWNQPDVRRYLFDDDEVTLERTRGLLADSDAGFEQRSLGLWCAQRADGEARVGFAGFLHSDGEPELVFGLHPCHWGRGLATEAAGRVIAYAFGQPGIQRVVASVDEPNRASIRVLERLGLRRTHRDVVEGKPLLYYALDRESG